MTKFSEATPVDPISITMDERWELGVNHHPKTEELINSIMEIDKEWGWPLDMKFGGDGDEGETLAYILDAHFERIDYLKELRDGQGS